MSKKTAFIRARTEPEVKERAEAVFRGVGLSPSRAVDLFYRQVALRGELPVELKLPNELTEAAIEDARARRNLIEADSADELFDLLDEE
jgi:DNA-damage-inducible protein J